jgi:hypothetical protein
MVGSDNMVEKSDFSARLKAIDDPQFWINTLSDCGEEEEDEGRYHSAAEWSEIWAASSDSALFITSEDSDNNHALWAEYLAAWKQMLTNDFVVSKQRRATLSLGRRKIAIAHVRTTRYFCISRLRIYGLRSGKTTVEDNRDRS